MTLKWSLMTPPGHSCSLLGPTYWFLAHFVYLLGCILGTLSKKRKAKNRTGIKHKQPQHNTRKHTRKEQWKRHKQEQERKRKRIREGKKNKETEQQTLLLWILCKHISQKHQHGPKYHKHRLTILSKDTNMDLHITKILSKCFPKTANGLPCALSGPSRDFFEPTEHFLNHF